MVTYVTRLSDPLLTPKVTEDDEGLDDISLRKQKKELVFYHFH